MNWIKLFGWFFIIFLNYAIFQANMVVGIVFVLIEVIVYIRLKGRAFGQRYETRRFRTNRAEVVENSNATMLVLELMKMERMENPTNTILSNEIRYHCEEHKKLRKAFER